jgi:hypothetical protein
MFSSSTHYCENREKKLNIQILMDIKKHPSRRRGVVHLPERDWVSFRLVSSKEEILITANIRNNFGITKSPAGKSPCRA